MCLIHTPAGSDMKVNRASVVLCIHHYLMRVKDPKEAVQQYWIEAISVSFHLFFLRAISDGVGNCNINID